MKTYRLGAFMAGFFGGVGCGFLLVAYVISRVVGQFQTTAGIKVFGDMDFILINVVFSIIFIALGIILEVYCHGKLNAEKIIAEKQKQA